MKRPVRVSGGVLSAACALLVKDRQERGKSAAAKSNASNKGKSLPESRCCVACGVLIAASKGERISLRTVFFIFPRFFYQTHLKLKACLMNV